jgi:hypothetical protein
VRELARFWIASPSASSFRTQPRSFGQGLVAGQLPQSGRIDGDRRAAPLVLAGDDGYSLLRPALHGGPFNGSVTYRALEVVALATEFY